MQDVTYKILATLIKNKLVSYIERAIGDYQCGFRQNRSVTDQIFTLKQIMNHSFDHNLPLHILFIDFKQAYDSIKKRKLIEAMESLQVPEKLVRLTDMTLKQTECKIVLKGRVSKGFIVNQGLRQGDPVSVVLFNLVLEKVLRESKLYTSGVLYQHKHQCIMYADDLALITRSIEELRDTKSCKNVRICHK